ncbi:DUF4230 domain-containing protein [Hallella mizrahii]|uniref:DUF4230 domain-containing protein n=1 Tax=Hallella mizrahii TaxID=2606637 RepID=A0A7K0KIR8_9BACT|nr:DUF4230 domain-containing protein [Hallella mizrahii]MST85833.1 DUF4230 domain-containing protein [Hallella mizrahii]
MTTKRSLLSRLLGRASTDLRLVLISATVTLVLVVAAVFLIKRALTDQHIEVSHNQEISITPVVMESIRNTGQWVFMEIADEELVDTVRHGFFGDDELARVYYGTLRLGFDMQQYKEEWLCVKGDTLIATLPPIGLVDDNFLDEARTRSFYESGKWSEEDRAALAKKAKDKMRQRCLSKSNLASARKSARTQLWTMFRALGFKNIRIENK